MASASQYQRNVAVPTNSFASSISSSSTEGAAAANSVAKGLRGARHRIFGNFAEIERDELSQFFAFSLEMTVLCLVYALVAFSALTLLVGGRKGIQPVKTKWEHGGRGH